ncbi:MAG: hypothetical protein ABIR26_13415 [Ramlibacter sp.]
MKSFIQGLADIRRRGLSDAQKAGVQPQLWGLALSGGGIRSATFCLGLLHSLAKNKVFHRFDVLSSVSGGGYVASMVGRLFHQVPDKRGTVRADVVEKALGDADGRWFTWWLRANGRYLIPRGTRDAFFAAASFGRNLVAVHIELALLAILFGLVLSGLDIAVWQWVDGWSSGPATKQGWRSMALAALTGWPTVWLLLPVVGAAGAVTACAYWVFPSDTEEGIPGWRWIAMLVAIMGLGAVVLGWQWLRSGLYLTLPVLAIACGFVASFIGGSLIAGVLLWIGAGHAAVRNRLTGTLGWLLTVGAGVFLAGCIDYLAWHLSIGGGSLQGPVAIGIVIAGVLLRALLPKAAELPRNFPPAIRQSLGSIINLAGLMVLIGLIIFWVSLVHGQVTKRLFVALNRQPEIPNFEFGWYALIGILVPALLMFVISASNVGFLNKSSLYSFYKARLVRGYLGAANGKRFGEHIVATERVPEVRDNESLTSVNRVHGLDDMPLADYQPHAFGGPIHLVNVCANQTRDPRGGLFNQDRKGILVTVGPGRMRAGTNDWEQIERERAMSLGSWMAISGAAVSPGLGQATRPGIAALAMMAGLRLGYWWERQKSEGFWRRFGKYGMLFSELLGRFDIEGKAHWFLSDGGHFENTAAFALIREKCALVVLADCGADPRYAFGDLENLVRKARIDLQADIKFLKPRAHLNRGWEPFGSLSDIASTESSASLALARIDYAGIPEPGYLIVVKPTMCAGLPVDLVNFKADNATFPQDPTSDQFFDEAQWESYFRLGTLLSDCLTPVLLDSVPAVAKECFEIDDGALTEAGGPHPAGPTAAAAASAEVATSHAKRLPARVVAAGAVTASISIGAIASLGITAYQAINSEAKQRQAAEATDATELKELTKLYSELLASKVDERGKAVVTLAATLARLAAQVCTGPSVKGYRSSAHMQMVVEEARRSCQEAGAANALVCKQLVEGVIEGDGQGQSSACLLKKPVPTCEPHYWIRDYARAPNNCRSKPKPVDLTKRPLEYMGGDQTEWASQPGNDTSRLFFWIPGTGMASAILPPELAQSAIANANGDANANASAPSTEAKVEKPCSGKTIYIQIYGPEQRQLARTLRVEWRALGANVPPIDDVVQSARQEQRTPPTPYATTTIIQHQPELQACAESVRATGKNSTPGTPNWAIKPLPERLTATPNTLEVWLPPIAAAK